MLDPEHSLKIEGDSVLLEITSHTRHAAFWGARPDVIVAAQDPKAREAIMALLEEHGMPRGRLSTHAAAEGALVYGSLPVMHAEELRKALGNHGAGRV